MGMETKPNIDEEVHKAVGEVSGKILNKLSELLQEKGTGGNAVIKINAASPALSIAITCTILCCVLSIATIIGGTILYLNMKDHLDAIYMIAPQIQQDLNHVKSGS